MKIIAAAGKNLIADLNPTQMERLHQAAGANQVVRAADTESQMGEIAEAEVLFGAVTPELIERGRNLKWVHTLGAGVDRIMPALQGRGIRLTSEKGGVGPHLAEHAFALLLGITRGIHTAIRNPNWDQRPLIRPHQWELTDRSMTIIGFGGTGRAIAQRARGFDLVRVTAVDPEPIADTGTIDRLYSFDEIDRALGEADIVMVTAPLTPVTRNLFNRERFAAMKRGSIIVNVSRGEIIEESALLAALQDGTLFGAGLDVVPREPLPSDHPLWSLPNAIITPHIAGGSPRRADRAVDAFCENLGHYQRGEPLVGEIDISKGY